MIARLRAFFQASAWIGVVGKLVLLAGGLVVLAWIGRAARASPTPMHWDALDGGAPFTVSSIAPAPSTPPPSSPVVSAPPPATAGTRATPDNPVYLNHAG